MAKVKRLPNFQATHAYAQRIGFPLTREGIQNEKKRHFSIDPKKRKKGSLFRHMHTRIRAGLFEPEHDYLHRLVRNWMDRQQMTGSPLWKQRLNQSLNGLIRRQKAKNRLEAAQKMMKDITAAALTIRTKLAELNRMALQKKLTEEEKVIRNGYKTQAQNVADRLDRTLPYLNAIVLAEKKRSTSSH